MSRCSGQHADDRDAIAFRLVENPVLLKAFDPPVAQPRESRVIRRSGLVDAWHTGEFLERRVGGGVEPQGRFQAGLAREVVGLIVQVAVAGGESLPDG